MKRKSAFRWFLILALFTAAGLGVQRILKNEGIEWPKGFSFLSSISHFFAPTAAQPAESGEYVILSPNSGRLTAQERDELASEARRLTPAAPDWEKESGQVRPARRKQVSRPFHTHR